MAFYHEECYRRKYGKEWQKCCRPAFRCPRVFPISCDECQKEIKGYSDLEETHTH